MEHEQGEQSVEELFASIKNPSMFSRIPLRYRLALGALLLGLTAFFQDNMAGGERPTLDQGGMMRFPSPDQGKDRGNERQIKERGTEPHFPTLDPMERIKRERKKENKTAMA